MEQNIQTYTAGVRYAARLTKERCGRAIQQSCLANPTQPFCLVYTLDFIYTSGANDVARHPNLCISEAERALPLHPPLPVFDVRRFCLARNALPVA